MARSSFTHIYKNVESKNQAIRALAHMRTNPKGLFVVLLLYLSLPFSFSRTVDVASASFAALPS